jgi:glycosyltransferase involved in cell wall biosynthesis
MRTSVCMAAYNGARYIYEQINSILPQLDQEAEIIVIDDSSTDETVRIVEGIDDGRIRLIRHERNLGVVKTFERAIRESRGEIIFLADQDDVWHADKVAIMQGVFSSDPRVTLVLCNGELIDSIGRSLSRELFRESLFLPGLLPNLIKNRYQGSAMAFRRDVLEAVLPFPDGIPMHDSWIGLVNSMIGRAIYVPEKLLFYRRHEGNVTGQRHGSLRGMLGQRWRLAWSLALRLGAIIRVKRRLRGHERAISLDDVRPNCESGGGKPGTQSRAVIFAPFFSATEAASRPRFVGDVLAELFRVDVVTSDFDHSQKTKREQVQCHPFDEVIYLETRPYHSNVSVARLWSHLLFSLKSAKYYRNNRDKYDVVYATAPFNLLAWLVFKRAGAKTKIIDVVDIWPDVLPFSAFARKVLAPIFAIWKWFFKSAVGKADIVMAVSESFIRQASHYASGCASIKRFYIGHERLISETPKQSIFTIVYVGNLGRLYDFETLLDVLANEIFRKKLQLYVIGQGDRQDWLVGEMGRRKLQYHFFGAVYDPVLLAEILRSCHVGFNGYFNTTAAFSYKAATYFAAGLPILNSMTGDLHCLVKQYGLGENYEGGDRKQLSDCIVRVMNNDPSIMAANCEMFFASHLEADKIRAEMKDFLGPKLVLNRYSKSIDVPVVAETK